MVLEQPSRCWKPTISKGMVMNLWACAPLRSLIKRTLGVNDSRALALTTLLGASLVQRDLFCA